ncbi:MAG: DUF1566 domain-containing protein [Deltaproteobacteria bacterium]|nr:DUF1566 domain-containing protein [Deltaproteobacteria bacterium]
MEKTGGRYQKIKANGGCSMRRVLLLGVVLLAAPVPVRAADWKPLPDTGQTKCYDTIGNEMTCPAAGQYLYGQDAQYQGATPAYQDNGNQTVTDQKSGLVWMKSDDGTGRTWQGAVDYCSGLVFAGQSDWRLPSRFELDSIVDYGRSYPAINPVFSCQSSFYWSAIPYAGDPVYAWGIYFNDGGDHWLDKINKYYVRCVRAGL